MRKNTLKLGIAYLSLGLLCGCNQKKQVEYTSQTSQDTVQSVENTLEEIPIESEESICPEILNYQITGEQSDVTVVAKTKVPRNYSRCPIVEFTTSPIEDKDILAYADMIFDKDSHFLYMPYDSEQIGELRNKLTTIKDETADSELRNAIEEYHLPNMDFRLQNLSGQSETIAGDFSFYSVHSADLNNLNGIMEYNGSFEYVDACGLAGTINGEYYTMNFQKAGNNSCILIDRMDTYCNVSDIGSESFDVKLEGNSCTYSQEEANELAAEFVKKLGYDNMTMIQSNDVRKSIITEDEYIGEECYSIEGYNVYFARGYEDYSLAFNSMYFEGWLSGAYFFDEDGNMMIGSYQCPESIRVYVDSQGVCQLELWNPWKEKGIITDSANMIDFEDVDEIAKSEFENYTDNYISGYTIDEVVLGYTVVRDGDSVTLVPAWYYYADICDENDVMFFKNAKVIINALDGTLEHSFRY